MKKLIFIISVLCFLFSINKCFSQPFDCSKDDERSTFTEENYGVTQTYEYGKHWLSIWMDTSKLSDTNYFQSVIDFIQSQNSHITEVYFDTTIRNIASDFFARKGFAINIEPFDYTSVGSLNVRLSDTMDANTYINIFSSTNLFRSINLWWIARAQSYPLEPNDFYWSNQWYLKQSRSNSSPNHDIDANKAWWVTMGDASKVRIYIFDTGIRLSSNNANSVIDHQDISTTYFTKGTNFTSSLSIDDSVNHGTGVAGLIGATQNNSYGISGLSPK